MNKFMALTLNQAKRVSKEGLMLLLSVYPLMLALIGRYLVPFLNEAFKEKVDLTLHYPAILAFLILANPYIYGALAGFLLLDEREENVLQAIRVTPLTMNHYLRAKVGLFFVLSFVSGVILIKVANLMPIGLVESIIINFLLALAAPFNMILINTFAKNRVEGFAIVKGTGILIMLPLIAFYIPQKYNLLAGIVPGYWPAMALHKVIDSGFGIMPFWGYSMIGFVYMLLLIKLLNRKFEKNLS